MIKSFLIRVDVFLGGVFLMLMAGVFLAVMCIPVRKRSSTYSCTSCCSVKPHSDG